MADPGLSTAFLSIAALAERHGVSGMNRLDAPWTHQIDAAWWVAVNGKGTEEPVRVTARGGTPHDSTVPGYHALVYFNGWPAGLLHPYGGTFAAGSLANEDAFIAACRAGVGEPRGG